MKSILKSAGLAALAVFQVVMGSVIVALVCHDLAVGRWSDWWNITCSVLSGLVLGVGGVVSSAGYAALAVEKGAKR